MGGSVKVVIRFKDGKVKCQTRHTNALPYWFNQNYDFIIEPEKVCKEYISKNKESGYYVSGATNSPDGYGIVVIDLLKNEIISCQGYTEFNFLHSGSLAVSLSLYNSFDLKLKDSDIPYIKIHNEKEKLSKDLRQFFGRDSEQFKKEVLSLYKMVINEKIVRFNFDTKKEEPFKFLGNRLTGNKLWLRTLKFLKKRNIYKYCFVIKRNQKVFTYEDSEVGFNKVFNKMKKNGFKFSNKALKEWREFYEWNEYDFKNLIK